MSSLNKAARAKLLLNAHKRKPRAFSGLWRYRYKHVEMNYVAVFGYWIAFKQLANWKWIIYCIPYWLVTIKGTHICLFLNTLEVCCANAAEAVLEKPQHNKAEEELCVFVNESKALTVINVLKPGSGRSSSAPLQVTQTHRQQMQELDVWFWT